MINCVVAVEKNHGIGLLGRMPWPHLAEDLKWFKRLTLNNVVIMGSTTWKSIGSKPLSNRINVVLSKTTDYSGENGADHTFSDPQSALTFCQNEYPDKEIFVIGGSAIYEQYKSKIESFYVTEIDCHYVCDRFFYLDYVKQNYSQIREIDSFIDPVPFTIKQYTK